MPARVVVISGEEKGAEFWIEEEVVRIGSADNCGIRMNSPGFADHTATLEYRNGEYLVHNRTGQSLWLDEQALEEQDFAVWADGSQLQIGDQVTLQMVIEGDPAPSKHMAPVYTQEEEDEDEENGETPAETLATDEKKSNTGVQLFVIAIAIIGLAVFLFWEPGSTDSPKGKNTDTEFNELIEKLVAAERVKDKTGRTISPDVAEAMRKSLQKGRLAELRPYSDSLRSSAFKEANEHYDVVRDYLLEKKNEIKLDDFEKEVLEFVIKRRGKLAKSKGN